VVLALVVIAGAGFGIGWAVAPGDDDHDRTRNAVGVVPSPERFPAFPRFLDPRSTPNSPTAPNNRGADANQASLGVGVEDSTSPRGARIRIVQPAGGAARAGLKVDDVITGVNNDGVASAGDLVKVIGGRSPGEKVTISYTRGSETGKVTVILGGRLV